MYRSIDKFKLYNKNKIQCTIEGIISSDFVEKDVNGRKIFQSKIYSTDSIFDKELISFINNLDKSTINTDLCPAILLNFWHTDVFFSYKNLLKKGTKIKANGVIGFKVYERKYTADRLHLFFAVNDILDIKVANTPTQPQYVIESKMLRSPLPICQR